MATSFTIAARHNGYAKADATGVTLASVRAYREAMAEFAQMSNMDVWYAVLTEQEVMGAFTTLTKKVRSKEEAAQVKMDENVPGRTWRRHIHATASRPCRNSPRSSTVSTGWSVSHRW